MQDLVLSSGYTYTLDSEDANVEVSKRQYKCGNDCQLMIWGLKFVVNFFSPVLFTLPLHEDVNVAESHVYPMHFYIINANPACFHAFSEHDNVWKSLLPDHPPEVRNGVRHGSWTDG